jgi:UDP-2-acetamido-3-amino-2,3-dideoxy-glucuronate N-acetyltransferase
MSNINLTVVGCGYWGKNLVRNFAELGALSAVVDHDPALAQTFADQYSVPALSWPDILADETIDAVAIATPAAQHSGLAAAALDAGKHVFVEKPLALDASEAEMLCQKAEAVDRTLMVGHLLQYHPAFERLQEIVHEGWLEECPA